MTHSHDPCTLSRRQLILAGLGASLLPLPLRSKAAEAAGEEPHFFLHIFMPGGMDATCTFDARPLAMTAANLQVNYLGEEPKVWQDGRGGSTLRSSLTDPLQPFFDRFSLINGVMMTSDFDGHEDSQSVTFTGNPLGGDSYFDTFATLPHSGPLSMIHFGSRLIADARILSYTGLRMPTNAVPGLVNGSRHLTDLSNNARLNDFFKARFSQRPGEKGSYAKTKQLMQKNLGQISDIRQALGQLKLSPSISAPSSLDTIALLTQIFRSGLSKAALYVFDTDLNPNQNLDAHSFEDAKKQPSIIKGLMAELAAMLDYLRKTPFDAQRSFLDVTTVLISSEFTRTMRQTNVDFAQSGTDHNPLTNSFFIGGKGIRGGLVLGASDYASAGEQLSKAHLTIDNDQKKMIARPFDIARSMPSFDLPEQFHAGHYLGCGSIINTVFKAMNVEQRLWQKMPRQETALPSLDVLLG